jgi:hypothetical protein
MTNHKALSDYTDVNSFDFYDTSQNCEFGDGIRATFNDGKIGFADAEVYMQLLTGVAPYASFVPGVLRNTETMTTHLKNYYSRRCVLCTGASAPDYCATGADNMYQGAFPGFADFFSTPSCSESTDGIVSAARRRRAQASTPAQSLMRKRYEQGDMSVLHFDTPNIVSLNIFVYGFGAISTSDAKSRMTITSGGAIVNPSIMYYAQGPVHNIFLPSSAYVNLSLAINISDLTNLVIAPGSTITTPDVSVGQSDASFELIDCGAWRHGWDFIDCCANPTNAKCASHKLRYMSESCCPA